jgi:sortase A
MTVDGDGGRWATTTTVAERPAEAPHATPSRSQSWRASARLPKFRIRLKKAGPRSPMQHLVTWSLLAFGLLATWIIGYSLGVSSLQHSHDQGVLFAQLREGLADGKAPLGGLIKPGTPVAFMDMPAAGLHHEVIVEGTSSGDLINGPGHRRDTPLPGQAGVSLIYGRASLFGGPFGSIASVHPGATITVTTVEGVATYIVERVRHAGDPFPLVTPGHGRLTLVTAESSGWRSGWAPTRAVYVDAALQGQPFPAPGSATTESPAYRCCQLTTVPNVELAMKGDPRVLYILVLWLPVLVFGAIAAVWAQDRWGRWQTWLVGVPVILAGLWGVSESAIQLLPNLM